MNTMKHYLHLCLYGCRNILYNMGNLVSRYPVGNGRNFCANILVFELTNKYYAPKFAKKLKKLLCRNVFVNSLHPFAAITNLYMYISILIKSLYTYYIKTEYEEICFERCYAGCH